MSAGALELGPAMDPFAGWVSETIGYMEAQLTEVAEPPFDPVAELALASARLIADARRERPPIPVILGPYDAAPAPMWAERDPGGRRSPAPDRIHAPLGHVAGSTGAGVVVSPPQASPAGQGYEVFDRRSGSDWHPGFGVKARPFTPDMAPKRRPRLTIYQEAGTWAPGDS